MVKTLPHSTASVDTTPAEIVQPKLWPLAAISCILLAIEFYFLTSGMNEFQVENVSKSSVQIASLREFTNQIRRKPFKTIRWQNIAKDSVLYFQDNILTLKDSKAMVEFSDGTELLIESETLVVLAKTPDDTTKSIERLVVNLKRGSLAKVNKSKTPLRVLVGTLSNENRLASDTKVIEDKTGQSVFTIAKEQNGTATVKVLEGSLEVKSQSNSKIVEVNSKESLKLTGADYISSMIENVELEYENLKKWKAVPEKKLEKTRETTDSLLQPKAEKNQNANNKLAKPSTKTHQKTRIKATGVKKEKHKSSSLKVKKQHIKEPELLNAPKVFKPKIHIKEGRKQNSDLRRTLVALLQTITSFLIHSAEASDGRKIVIDVEWAPLQKASKYNIQISNDKKFKQMIVNEFVDKTMYSFKHFRTSNAQTLYYRVAGVDAKGLIGRYSDSIEFQIGAIQKRAPYFEAALGGYYQNRKFVSKANPKTVNASGIVPLGLDFSIILNPIAELLDIHLHSFFVLENAQNADSSNNVESNKLFTPFFQTALFAESHLMGLDLGLGPYFTFFEKISWDGRKLVHSTSATLGAAGILSNNLRLTSSWQWRVQWAAVFLNAIGGDLSASIRKKPFSNMDLYLQPLGFARWTTAETGYGGGMQIGYAF